ncbi:MAG TPA: uracil-DNA glycosylase [Acidimicrobiales bacterium]|jgi:uracil-DNA glycosylase family 4|nr:uracil-DNA glycosylase [Acidimicrobiales bacterium]
MERAEVRAQILTCQRCPLHLLGNGPVPFRGNPHAELLVVGEAPGRWEDRQRKPFVGPSGSLLGRYLSQAGFENVAYANTVSCWPNRAQGTPTWPEVDACAKNLDDQIEYLKPERILLVGLTAVGAFYPNLRLEQVRGRWFTIKGIPTLTTYHPAAVLRDPGLGVMMAEDIRKALIGPTLTARDERDYSCVKCERPAEVWVSEGRDVTRGSGLGIGWCIRDLRGYRRKWRGAGGGAVQMRMEYSDG